MYSPRDEKSKSRFFPELEKGPRGRSWVNPHQGDLGRKAGEQGEGPASAGQRGLISEPGLPQHLGARLEEGSQRYWSEWSRAWESPLKVVLGGLHREGKGSRLNPGKHSRDHFINSAAITPNSESNTWTSHANLPES